MSQVATLAAKEVRTLFTSPIAYAVIAVFIVLSGYTFTVSLIVSKQATLVHIFFQAAVQLILLVPLITMRQFAEERRSGTLEAAADGAGKGNRHRRREVHRLHGGAGSDDQPHADLCRRAVGLWRSGLGSDLQWLRRSCDVGRGTGLDRPDDLGIDRQPDRRSRGVPRTVRDPLGDRHAGVAAAATLRELAARPVAAWRISRPSRSARCTCPTSGSSSPSSCSACS